MHKEQIQEAGDTVNASKAVVMLHGRGGSAADFLSLAADFNLENYALYAPQATNNTWYPYSFLAAPEQNEPWLSSALELVGKTVHRIIEKGIPKERIYFLGFSQGACLALEYLGRHAARYGGAAAFTGGLIGDKLYPENYQGDFNGMPVFIGTSEPDSHVPVERVHSTARIFKTMGADVTEKMYKNMGHTIIQDEIDSVNRLLFN
ncbi:MAG TPA: dienelactone hydrolase family protein [Anseongella sp.]|nr:dienelactone hydrolase family protein [Anseongella sp.]